MRKACEGHEWGPEGTELIIIIIIIIINDIYPGSSTHSRVVFREVMHPFELE